MWCLKHMQRTSWLKHMQRTSWRAKKSNENVLRQICHNTRLLKSIKIRQMKFLGHVIRNEKLEQSTRETTTNMPTCNSSEKAQPLLSMTHVTGNYGKKLLMRQSMSGSDRIQDDDDGGVTPLPPTTQLPLILLSRAEILELLQCMTIFSSIGNSC